MWGGNDPQNQDVDWGALAQAWIQNKQNTKTVEPAPVPNPQQPPQPPQHMNMNNGGGSMAHMHEMGGPRMPQMGGPPQAMWDQPAMNQWNQFPIRGPMHHSGPGPQWQGNSPHPPQQFGFCPQGSAPFNNPQDNFPRFQQPMNNMEQRAPPPMEPMNRPHFHPDRFIQRPPMNPHNGSFEEDVRPPPPFHQEMDELNETSPEIQQQHHFQDDNWADAAIIAETAKQKKLPLWIKEELEKIDAKKRREEERKRIVEREREEEWDKSRSRDPNKSKFDSESESDQELPQEDNVSDKEEEDDEKPSQDEPSDSESNKEETLEEKMAKVGSTLTTILLDVTDSEIRLIARECLSHAASTIAKSATVNTRTKTLGLLAGYGSDSTEEDSEEKEPQTTDYKETEKKTESPGEVLKADHMESHLSSVTHPKAEDEEKVKKIDEGKVSKTKSKDKKRRSRSTDRDKRSRSKERKKRSRSRERKRRSRSHDHDRRSRERSKRSRDRRRSRSRSRRRSRSRSHGRSKRSRDRGRRSRSYDGKRSSQSSKKSKKRRKHSRSRSRSYSYDKKSKKQKLSKKKKSKKSSSSDES